MPHIELREAQAWLEPTKASLGAALDPDMEESIAAQVLSRAASSYDTSGWVSPETTPSLIRKVIGMKYASWFYNRQYSEDDTVNDYALLLNGQADILLDGIATGTNELPDAAGGGDVSSSMRPSYEPSSPVFTMGKVF
jgi:hypothetical protein